MTGGVYAYRTRKPNARFRIPILSYHWAYVGQTSSFWHRHRQHMGTGTLAVPGVDGPVQIRVGQPWVDLEPRAYRLTLPNWEWLRLALELFLIGALWPVYNDRENRWNPRRIPIRAAREARARRDAGRRDMIVWPFGLLFTAVIVVIVIKIVGVS